jgi:hypothetical protein
MLLTFMLAFSPGVCCCSFAGLGAAEGGTGLAACRGDMGRAKQSAAAPARAAKSCCSVANPAPAPAPDEGRDCHCHDVAKVAPQGAKLATVPASGGGGTIDLVPLGMPLPGPLSATGPSEISPRGFGAGRDPHPPPLSLVAQHCLLLI